MKYAGVDLHKQSITVCVVNQARQVLERKRFLCEEPLRIREYFQNCGPCQVVVEATASYEWLLQLIEPLVERTVLAHPKKLRVIAESTRKSDKLDAQVLAEFLAMDMIPRSYRPTPRQRAHRRLVRQRLSIVRRVTSAKNRLRRILSDYNADRVDLFSIEGRTYLRRLPLSSADRFAADQMCPTTRRGTPDSRIRGHRSCRRGRSTSPVAFDSRRGNDHCRGRAVRNCRYQTIPFSQARGRL
jgi:hypothetical protein